MSKLRCPRLICIEDLVQFIKLSRVNGDKVILVVDTNKHVFNRKLAKRLKILEFVESFI